MNTSGRIALSIAALLSAHCGGFAPYVRAGYDSKSDSAVKHIALIVWAEDSETGGLAARIASERVKFKTNYLVYREALTSPGWATACAHPTEENERLQGVLEIRLIDVVRDAGDVALELEGRLMRCADGALLWRAQTRGRESSQDEDLSTFKETYQGEFPNTAQALAIPIFVKLIELLDTLPKVFLSEEEEITKIELS